MLTGDLVRASVQKKAILPRLVDPDDAGLLALAAELIAAFQGHIGATRGELRAVLEARARGGDRLRLERGLAKLLEDRSEFERPSTLDPETVRAALFERAARARAEGAFDRERVVAEAAVALASEPAALESAVDADRRVRERLLSFETLEPRALLVRYNVGLCQAILLRATRVLVRIEARPARVRHVLRAIKFRRLLFRAWEEKGALFIELDGPLSIFEASTKYGLELAAVLPVILLCETFAIAAEVAWGKRRLRKMFGLSSEDRVKSSRIWLRSPIPDPGAAPPPELEAFARRFEEIAPGWKVDDRVPVLSLGEGEGRDALVPDLRLVHEASGRVAYLEVLARARKGLVARRLEQMREPPEGLIVAVARELVGDAKLPRDVVAFKAMPSAKDVVACLEKMPWGER